MRSVGKASGYNHIIDTKNGEVSLFINFENQKQNNTTGQSESGVTATGIEDGKKVVIKINQKDVKDVSPTTGNTLTIALRKVDYCDSDGKEYKMLVLCSEPFTED
tara:strand:- start:3641 stop:3955 length:315 start_codon:yes stop_codon:yes gene_type:complete